MMHDVDRRLATQGPFPAEHEFVVCGDLLYADDTMLIGSSRSKLQSHLELVVDEGQRYGLEINWAKTVVLQVGCSHVFRQNDGSPLKTVDQTVYLGALLSVDGRAHREVSRRLGEAGATFKQLTKCWSHSSIARSRKIEIYRTVVVAKLTYSLESIWLLSAELLRINAFHVRCLRQILRIAPSYVSRITNSFVLASAGERPLANDIQKAQIKLYRKIASMGADSILRRLVCEPDSNMPKDWLQKKKRGRPKQQWATCVYNMSLLGNHDGTS